MDQVVIDSSVAIKWLVAEPQSADAHRVLAQYQAGQFELLVPDLIFAEVGNIVWKKVQFQGLAVADAQTIIDAFRQLTFIVTPMALLLADAFQLAITHQRTVYDAMYLALSLREKCRFVTADLRLVNAVSAALPSVVWVGNWP